jgi:hypothetical protein
MLRRGWAIGVNSAVQDELASGLGSGGGFHAEKSHGARIEEGRLTVGVAVMLPARACGARRPPRASRLLFAIDVAVEFTVKVADPLFLIGPQRATETA